MKSTEQPFYLAGIVNSAIISKPKTAPLSLKYWNNQKHRLYIDI